MIPWEKLAHMCVCAVVLTACASAEPIPHEPTPSVTDPPPSAVFVNGVEVESADELLAKLLRTPSPDVDLGPARCLLWHPKLPREEAFLALVVVNGEELAGRINVDEDEAPFLILFFLKKGYPFDQVVGERLGWVAVCKDPPDPHQVYAL